MVILNRASSLLKFQVVRNGRPVYQKTPGLFAAFCSRTLMRNQLPDKEVLAECTRRIGEAPVGWQPDLYLGLAVFSSLRFTREIILKVIEVAKMEASPLFDGIREKWVDQGKEQGEKIGARKERIEVILEALDEFMAVLDHETAKLKN